MSAWLIRLCVSALLLALIFYLVPFKEVWAAARQISPLLWLGALGLFLAGHAAAAAKWRILIGGGISYRQAFRAHLAGLAANLALPSVAGGDVVRAGLVMKHADDKGRLAMGSLADRLIDTLGLILIALASAWLAWGPRLDSDLWMGWPLLGLLFLAAGGLVAAVALDRFASRREPSGKLMRCARQADPFGGRAGEKSRAFAALPGHFDGGAVPVRRHQHRLRRGGSCRGARRRVVLCLDHREDHRDRADQPWRAGRPRGEHGRPARAVRS